MARFCGACGGALVHAARFCGACGAPVAAASGATAALAPVATPIATPRPTVSPRRHAPGVHFRTDPAGARERFALRHSSGANQGSAPLNEAKAATPFSAATRAALAQTILVVPAGTRPALQRVLDEGGARCLDWVSVGFPDDLLAQVRATVRAHGTDQVRYLCLVGNWDDVPPVVVENPLEGDDDQFCRTDLPYGLLDDSKSLAFPEVAVGRIPVADATVFARLLRLAEPDPRMVAPLTLAVSAECWRDATVAIVAQVIGRNGVHKLTAPTRQLPRAEPAVLLSPQWDLEAMQTAWGAGPTAPHQALLFNVHGSGDVTGWYGEGQMGGAVHVFGPGMVADYREAFLFSEACYGGALGYDDPSVVEDFFDRGGAAMVGSSTIAYGSCSSELCMADLMALHFLQALNRGQTMGEAMDAARLGVLEGSPPLQIDMAAKTILSFNLFGLPWLARPVPSANAAGAGYGTDQRPAGSVLDRVRGAAAGPPPGARPGTAHAVGAGSTSALARWRTAYRSRLAALQREYFENHEQALARLRTFRDYAEIRQTLISLGGDPEAVTLEAVRANDQSGYRLHCKTGPERQARHLIVLTDEQGILQLTLTSKSPS